MKEKLFEFLAYSYVLILLFGGPVLCLLLYLSYKKLRIKRVYFACLLISLLMAALRINISDSLHLKEQKYGVINFLYSPLIFMLTYSVLRYFFLKIFGNEPIQAGFYQTSWEQGEYRKLHWGDIIFTILLILIPLGSVVLVGKL